MKAGHVMRSAFTALSEDGQSLVLGEYKIWRKATMVQRSGQWVGTKRAWLYAFSRGESAPVDFVLKPEAQE
jgi:hypothetical protein